MCNGIERTWDMLVSEAHVEQVYSGLVGLEFDLVLPSAELLRLDVGSMGTLEGDGDGTVTWRMEQQHLGLVKV